MTTTNHTPIDQTESVQSIRAERERLRLLGAPLAEEAREIFRAREGKNGPPEQPLTEREKAIRVRIAAHMNGHTPPDLASSASSRELEILVEIEALERIDAIFAKQEEAALYAAAVERASELQPRWLSMARAYLLGVVRVQELDNLAHKILRVELCNQAVQDFPIRYQYLGEGGLFGRQDETFDPLRELKTLAIAQGVVTQAELDAEIKRTRKEFSN